MVRSTFLKARLRSVGGCRIKGVKPQYISDGIYKSLQYVVSTPAFDATALLLCLSHHTYSVWRQIKFPVLKYDLIPGNREHRTKFGIR